MSGDTMAPRTDFLRRSPRLLVNPNLKKIIK